MKQSNIRKCNRMNIRIFDLCRLVLTSASIPKTLKSVPALIVFLVFRCELEPLYSDGDSTRRLPSGCVWYLSLQYKVCQCDANYITPSPQHTIVRYKYENNHGCHLILAVYGT